MNTSSSHLNSNQMNVFCKLNRNHERKISWNSVFSIIYYNDFKHLSPPPPPPFFFSRTILISCYLFASIAANRLTAQYCVNFTFIYNVLVFQNRHDCLSVYSAPLRMHILTSTFFLPSISSRF